MFAIGKVDTQTCNIPKRRSIGSDQTVTEAKSYFVDRANGH